MEFCKENHLICRTCGCESQGTTSVFVPRKFEASEMLISDAIMKSASVQVQKEDGLPQQICFKCLDKLSMVLLFIELCERTDSKFRLNFEQVVVENCENQMDWWTETESLREQEETGHTKNLESDVLENSSTNSIPNEYGSNYEGTSETVKVEDEDYRVQLFNCKECNFIYDNRTTYEAHLKEGHASVTNAQQRAEEAPRKDESHTNDATPPPIKKSLKKCKAKAAKCTSDAKLGRSRDLVKKGPFTCETCGFGCFSASTLGTHKVLHKSGVKLFKCVVCGLSYNKSASLVAHKKIHGRFKCDDCEFTSTRKRSVDLHRITHSEDRYKCDTCGYTCRSEGILEAHKIAHSGKKKKEKRYKCDYCAFTSDLKAVVALHEVTHTGEKFFLCEICGYSCIRKIQLINHNASHFPELKTFKCDVCAYSSPLRSSLNTHKKESHGLEKPFKCDVCDFRCKKNIILVRHKMSHSDEKPFNCEFCAYKSHSQHNFAVHSRIHTGERPFKCDLCPFSSISKSHLKRHGLSHLKEKPFKCDLCDYGCIKKAQLVVHKMAHTGIKPFVCHICGRSYTRTETLRSHLKIHDGK